MEEKYRKILEQSSSEIKKQLDAFSFSSDLLQRKSSKSKTVSFNLPPSEKRSEKRSPERKQMGAFSSSTASSTISTVSEKIKKLVASIELIHFHLNDGEKVPFPFSATLNVCSHMLAYESTKSETFIFGKDCDLIEQLAKEGARDAIELIIHMAEAPKKPDSTEKEAEVPKKPDSTEKETEATKKKSGPTKKKSNPTKKKPTQTRKAPLVTTAMISAYQAKQSALFYLLATKAEDLSLESYPFNEIVFLVLQNEDPKALVALSPHFHLLHALHFTKALTLAVEKEEFTLLRRLVLSCKTQNFPILKLFLHALLARVFGSWKDWDQMIEAKTRLMTLIEEEPAISSDESFNEMKDHFVGSALRKRVEKKERSFIRLIIQNPMSAEISTGDIEYCLTIIRKEWNEEAFEMVGFLLDAFLIPKKRGLARDQYFFLAHWLFSQKQMTLLEKVFSLPMRPEKNPHLQMGAQIHSHLQLCSNKNHPYFAKMQKIAYSSPSFLHAAVSRSDVTEVSQSIERIDPIDFFQFWRIYEDATDLNIRIILRFYWRKYVQISDRDIGSKGENLNEEMLIFLENRLIEAAKRNDLDGIVMIKALIGKKKLSYAKVKVAMQSLSDESTKNLLRDMAKVEKECIIL